MKTIVFCVITEAKLPEVVLKQIKEGLMSDISLVKLQADNGKIKLPEKSKAESFDYLFVDRELLTVDNLPIVGKLNPEQKPLLSTRLEEKEVIMVTSVKVVLDGNPLQDKNPATQRAAFQKAIM